MSAQDPLLRQRLRRQQRQQLGETPAERQQQQQIQEQRQQLRQRLQDRGFEDVEVRRVGDTLRAEGQQPQTQTRVNQEQQRPQEQFGDVGAIPSDVPIFGGFDPEQALRDVTGQAREAGGELAVDIAEATRDIPLESATVPVAGPIGGEAARGVSDVLAANPDVTRAAGGTLAATPPAIAIDVLEAGELAGFISEGVATDIQRGTFGEESVAAERAEDLPAAARQRALDTIQFVEENPRQALGVGLGAAASLPLSAGAFRAGLSSRFGAVRGATRAADLAVNTPERLALGGINRLRGRVGSTRGGVAESFAEETDIDVSQRLGGDVGEPFRGGGVDGGDIVTARRGDFGGQARGRDAGEFRVDEPVGGGPGARARGDPRLEEIDAGPRPGMDFESRQRGPLEGFGQQESPGVGADGVGAELVEPQRGIRGVEADVRRVEPAFAFEDLARRGSVSELEVPRVETAFVGERRRIAGEPAVVEQESISESFDTTAFGEQLSFEPGVEAATSEFEAAELAELGEISLESVLTEFGEMTEQALAVEPEVDTAVETAFLERQRMETALETQVEQRQEPVETAVEVGRETPRETEFFDFAVDGDGDGGGGLFGVESETEENELASLLEFSFG